MSHATVSKLKIMWPRNDGPAGPGTDMNMSRRSKNSGFSGFISFMKRKDAEAAMRELDGFNWGGSVLRVGWSKAVSMASKPLYGVWASSHHPCTVFLTGVIQVLLDLGRVHRKGYGKNIVLKDVGGTLDPVPETAGTITGVLDVVAPGHVHHGAIIARVRVHTTTTGAMGAAGVGHRAAAALPVNAVKLRQRTPFRSLSCGRWPRRYKEMTRHTLITFVNGRKRIRSMLFLQTVEYVVSTFLCMLHRTKSPLSIAKPSTTNLFLIVGRRCRPNLRMK